MARQWKGTNDRKTTQSEKALTHCHSFHHWSQHTGLGSKPGVHKETPATDHLSQGTALHDPNPAPPTSTFIICGCNILFIFKINTSLGFPRRSPYALFSYLHITIPNYTSVFRSFCTKFISWKLLCFGSTLDKSGKSGHVFIYYLKILQSYVRVLT
jgi:hypothetical protein